MRYARTAAPIAAALLVAAPAAATLPAAAPDAGEQGLSRDGLHVVVDLEAYTVSLRHGERLIWRVPAGTGTGLPFEAGERSWRFKTPTGEFAVQYSELDPVWYRPDWYYLQRGLEVPDRRSPERRDPGALGHAAIYLGRGIAIHGTYLPEILGQPVSAGCIRIRNEYAVRLHHAVRRGTPVFIEGESTPRERPLDQPHVSHRPPWEGVRSGGTPEWVERMNAAIEAGSEEWADAALTLVARAMREGDGEAASGLLARLLDPIEDPAIEAELTAFVVHLYDHGAEAFLPAADRLAEADRARIARIVVEGAMAAFGGPLDGPAPWPSRRPHPDLRESETYLLVRDAEDELRRGAGVAAGI